MILKIRGEEPKQEKVVTLFLKQSSDDPNTIYLMAQREGQTDAWYLLAIQPDGIKRCRFIPEHLGFATEGDNGLIKEIKK